MLLPATPGWVSLPVVVGGPRHSWLGSAGGGGVWCVVCGGGVLVGLWLVCGVVGPSPLLAEVPVCYSPPLLAGFRCRWWWAVPATPGWGPLAAFLCGVWCVAVVCCWGCGWCVVWLVPRHSWRRFLCANPRHSWLGFAAGGGGRSPPLLAGVRWRRCCVVCGVWRWCVGGVVAGVWCGWSLATPGGGSCVLLPATPGWVSLPVVVGGPRHSWLGSACGGGVWCVVCGVWCVAVCVGGVGPSPLLAEVPVCYSPPLLAGFRCRCWWAVPATPGWGPLAAVVCGVWCVVCGGRVLLGLWRCVLVGLVSRHSWRRSTCATPRHSWLGFAAGGGGRSPPLLAGVRWRRCCVVCGVWRWCVGGVVAGVWCGWSLATPGGGSRVLLPATPGWVSLPVVVGGPRHSWLGSVGGVAVWCVVCGGGVLLGLWLVCGVVGPSPLLAEVPVCYSPPLLAGFRCRWWLAVPATPGWGPLAALLCGVWCVAVVCWWGCGWCVVWLVPRHSWRWFLCDTPRHSWLVFAAGGGGRSPSLLAGVRLRRWCVVCGVWCVVCGGGVLVGLWLVCGVVGPSPLLAEVPVCYSPPLLGGFRCRWWWAVPPTPGWGPLAAVVCGVSCVVCGGGVLLGLWLVCGVLGPSPLLAEVHVCYSPPLLAWFRCRWWWAVPATPGWGPLAALLCGVWCVVCCVFVGSLATPGGGSCVLLPATPGWVSLPLVVGGPRHSWLGSAGGGGVWCVVCGVLRWCVVGVVMGVWCGWSLATPGGGPCVLLPATPGWVSLPLVVGGPRHSWLGSAGGGGVWCVVCGGGVLLGLWLGAHSSIRTAAGVRVCSRACFAWPGRAGRPPGRVLVRLTFFFLPLCLSALPGPLRAGVAPLSFAAVAVPRWLFFSASRCLARHALAPRLCLPFGRWLLFGGCSPAPLPFCVSRFWSLLLGALVFFF